MYEGFVAFLTDIFQPEKVQFFTNKEQSLAAYRQQNLADITVFGNRDDIAFIAINCDP